MDQAGGSAVARAQDTERMRHKTKYHTQST